MSSPPIDADDAHSHKTHSEQPQPQHPLQATEQQLKARAEGVSIEDYLLPRSITVRLAKSVLPPQTSVQKDAVLAIQKAATVFVSYLSSHANESTLKRTVSPVDVLNAISDLEFEGFRPRLEAELDKFTEAKAAKRKPRKSGSAGAEQGDDGTTTTTTTETVKGIEGGEKKEVVVKGVKRVKRDGNGDGGLEELDEEDEIDEVDDGDGIGDHDEGLEEEHDEDATEEEGEEEEDDDDEQEGHEDEDIDRVEDLDRGSRRRMLDPDAGESDSDEEGPGSQLRGDMGLG